MKIQTVETPKNKVNGLDLDALNTLVDRHKKINQLIREGKDIDPELSKNFVTFPVYSHPYKG